MRLLNRSVGRLSRHRRGRLAGLVVLLLGLLLTGALYASVAPAQAGKAQSNEELIEEGRELFLVSCSFCHGQNGEGLLTKDGSLYMLIDEEHDPRRDGLTAFRQQCVDHMAHVVKVNGTLSEVEGQKALYVQGYLKK